MSEPGIASNQAGRHSRPLDVLVGRWRTDGHVVDHPDVRIIGTDTYRWLPGKTLLMHDVDVRVGGQVVQALELIGQDDVADDTWTARAFDNAGGVATMRATVGPRGIWTFTGGADVAPAAPSRGGPDGAVRSTLTVGEDRTRMHAAWERSDDGVTWRPWMDVRFTREDRSGMGSDEHTWRLPPANHRPARTAPEPLRRLDALVGTWQWGGRSSTSSFAVTGSTTLAWLPGGHFLVEHGALTSDGHTIHSVAVTGWDEARRSCTAHYSDTDGVRGTYEMAVNGDDVAIRWERVRFSGKIDRRTAAITGVWEQSPDGESWVYWYDAELLPRGGQDSGSAIGLSTTRPPAEDARG